jgi:hypothetical protein
VLPDMVVLDRYTYIALDLPLKVALMEVMVVVEEIFTFVVTIKCGLYFT